MKAEQTEVYNDTLQLMKNRLTASLNLLTKDKNKVDGALTQDLDDQSISVVNDQVIDELDRLERIELGNIEQAFNRIKNGTFGYCVDCSVEIEAKRLKALPYVLTCIECASNTDS